MRTHFHSIFAVCLVFTVLSTPLLAQEIPESKEHPYLFFRKGELEAIRQRFRRPPQSYYLEALIAQEKRDTGADQQLWAYLLTGQKKYRAKLMKWVKKEWDRTNFSSQWIGFKVATMSMVYDALYLELSEKERAQTKQYLERALDAHMKKMDGWLYNNPSNTVPAQCGAAGMAALALLWESPKAKRATKMSRKKLATFASQCFTPDGGYFEGSLYWGFAGTFYLLFSHAYHNATGDDSLINHPRLKKQHRFVETVLGGDGQFMPFNDTQPKFYGWTMCADLGRRFDHDLLLWLSDHMAAVSAGKVKESGIRVDRRGIVMAYTLLLLTQSEAGPTRKANRPFPGLPTLSHLDYIEWGVMRSNSALMPELVVGLKGSEGTLSHHKQKDLGSFVLYAGGEMLLIDPGYYQGAARSHTLPLINGKGPAVSGSRIVEARENRQWRVMVIDSTRAYGKTARRLRRTVLMYRQDAVIVIDDIVPGAGERSKGGEWPSWSPGQIEAEKVEKNRRVTAQYQAAHGPKINKKTGAVVIPGHEKDLWLWTFGPDLSLTSKKRKFGKSWRFKKLAQKGKFAWHSLTGEYDAEAGNPLVTVLMPAEKESSPAPPKYQRQGKTITVSLPGLVKVKFIKTDEGWRILRPGKVKGK